MRKPTTHMHHPAQSHMVGDGFRVSQYIPGYGRDMSPVSSPFLMLDYNHPWHIPPQHGGHRPGVGYHPHRGFETVTIVYSGEIAHRDTAGNSGTIWPGDIQWMTAGSGLLHNEYMSAEFARTGGTQHMVQLWVDLPKDLKMTPPTYQTILSQDISVHTYSGGYVRVVAGDMQVEGSRHIHGIAHTRSPVHIYDVCTTDIGSISLHIPAGYTTYVLCVHGTGYINDKTVHTGDMVELGHTGDEVCIGYRPIENIRNKKNESEYILKDTYLEKEEGRLVHTKTHVLPENTAEENIRNRENTTLYGRFLVMAGEPLGQDVVQHGPFVMTTHEDIYTAFVDYRSGKMGKIDTEK